MAHRKLSHMKAGVSYSHYTGSARLEINCLTTLMEKHPDDPEFKDWSKKVREWVSELSTMIAHLDKINNFK